MLETHLHCKIMNNMFVACIDIELISDVKHYVEASVYSGTSNKELARIFHVGERKLTDMFKTKFGISIQKYSLLISMEYAMALYLGGLSVKEIAITLNYREPANFTRAFIKIFGNPPSYYKKL